MIGTAAPTNTKKHKQMQHHAQIGNPRLRRFFSSSSFVSSSSFSNGSTSVVAFDRFRTPSSSLIDCTDLECSVGVSSNGILKTVFESMCKHTHSTLHLHLKNKQLINSTVLARPSRRPRTHQNPLAYPITMTVWRMWKAGFGVHYRRDAQSTGTNSE